MINIKCDCGCWTLVRTYEIIQEGLMVCRDYRGTCRCGQGLKSWEVKIEDLEDPEYLN